jgi:hypothetical protein
MSYAEQWRVDYVTPSGAKLYAYAATESDAKRHASAQRVRDCKSVRISPPASPRNPGR